jgi:hypothetical protein
VGTAAGAAPTTDQRKLLLPELEELPLDDELDEPPEELLDVLDVLELPPPDELDDELELELPVPGLVGLLSSLSSSQPIIGTTLSTTAPPARRRRKSRRFSLSIFLFMSDAPWVGYGLFFEASTRQERQAASRVLP